MKCEIILCGGEEDSAYIAEAPGSAGCMADGSTTGETLHNVEVVAKEWIETAQKLGRPVPVPKGQSKRA